MRRETTPRIAVIFAGGQGTRLANQSQPKQFVEVGGRSIIAWTLQIFQDSPDIDAIYLVSIQSHIGLMNEIINRHNFSKVRKVVPGGSYAMESVAIGLEAVLDDNQPVGSVVLLHDGVRPIISKDLIRRIIKSVELYGNGVTATPAYETLAASNDNGDTVSKMTERSEMFTLQAPQAFRLSSIHRAHLLGRQKGIHDRVVDQAHLISVLGHENPDDSLLPIRLVKGILANKKITTTDDLTYFEFLLSSGKYDEWINSSERN